ncbi:6-phosphofructokinase [Desertibacillus haloalkaliphilus]|uniref:6-phosphofructokinase n=1 Tax=Desertibacillus haloalkaliphilus TaxID=1328930 RepID=UPI001C268ABA|nr:6-phosphofructokinase [Desertibacillus haloalkaliphilus]MBU8906953.1 6-phosphofructokinase [Desertibacillus haloalkaliphilus]
MMATIGIINTSLVTIAVNEIISSLITKTDASSDQLVGIEIDASSHTLTKKVLNEKSKTTPQNQEIAQLRYSSIDENNQTAIAEQIDQYDALLIITEKDDIFEAFEQKNKVMYIQTSMFNDIEGSDHSVGFDSALNALTTNILQIKDTAVSMIYQNPRLFCIQIPGTAKNQLLYDTALAVDGTVMIDEHDEIAYEQLRSSILSKYEQGITYSFVLTNHSVDPSIIEQKLNRIVELDFKHVQFDEAQCMGPYPTAVDKILARKITNTITDWCQQTNTSSRLLIKEDQAIVTTASSAS